MSKQTFKIGDRVVPSTRNINWHVKHEEIYIRPGDMEDRKVEAQHLSDIFYWRAAKLGYLGIGKVLGYSDTMANVYYVVFKSEFGQTDAYFEAKDLKRVKATTKKKRRK